MIDAERLRAADRRELARAITLIESTRADHRLEADALLESIMPWTGNSLRIGITGTPGVGKSTLIESFGQMVIEQGYKLAVLTIDPSSSLSGGSILGDKTRMQVLSTLPNAFIRPSPAGKTLGGVARRTRECILLCEAAGFDLVLVETVGVGQSETLVSMMTDIFLLMLQPAGGDDLQGIKRGIMELADIVAINKADGDLLKSATRSAADIQQAQNLLRPRTTGWNVPVLTMSALKQQGLDKVWAAILDLKELLQSDQQWDKRRSQQASQWLIDDTREALYSTLLNDPDLEQELEQFEQAVVDGKLPASVAASRLVRMFHQSQE